MESGGIGSVATVVQENKHQHQPTETVTETILDASEIVTRPSDHEIQVKDEL